MARPEKRGIDYFPLETGFLNDLKVRRILKTCGASSISVLLFLLSNIYDDEGYFLKWNDDIAFLAADNLGLDEQEVLDVLKVAFKVGFFDENMFVKYNILTSKGIQERYIAAVSRRKKITLIKEFIVTLSCTNVSNNIIIVNINGVNDDINRVDVGKSTQSKVKESKVIKEKNIKEKKLQLENQLEKRKQEFYNSLIPYTNIYGREMIRDFYDYWIEPNKSKTKMRVDLEKTWDLERRLRAWAKRNKVFVNGNNKDDYRSAAEQRAEDAAAIMRRLAAEDDAAQHNIKG